MTQNQNSVNGREGTGLAASFCELPERVLLLSYPFYLNSAPLRGQEPVPGPVFPSVYLTHSAGHPFQAMCPPKELAVRGHQSKHLSSIHPST